MDMTQETVIPVQDLQEGDFLVGLDNGYVFTVEEDISDSISLDRTYNVSLGGDMVLVTFHDSNGDENYLILNRDFPVTVRSES